MPNIKQKVSRHNNAVKKKKEERDEVPPGCNCTKDPCPLDNKCQVDKVIYKATVTSNSSVETYTGLTGSTFKERHAGHNTSLKHRKYSTSTALSKHIWELKDKNENYDIVWSITDRAPTFNPITRACRLCLKEKYYIMFYPHLASLNERKEFFSTCRHRKQSLFENT